MATATAPSPQRVQQGPGVFVRVLLPAFLLLTLLAGVAAAVVYAVFWYLPRIADGRDLVLRRFEEPISFGGKEYNPYLWFGLLIPVLVIGLVYVIWMYVRDGVTIGWAWASFLGALRCTVYALLAIVFLLPALQAWETATTESKVVAVFDVSGSHLFVRDEVPGPDTPLEKLLTRQDKVLNFLGSERVNFFKRLHDKNPVTAYRFGRHLDESYLVLDKSGLLWTQDVWEKRQQNGEANPEGGPVKGAPLDYLRGWLKPELSPDVPENLNDKQREEFFKRLENLRRLTGATNLGTPLRKVYDREKNNLLQGIVVFTDGRNTEGSTDSLKALIEDARKADPQVPIFVVAVGEERERVRIEITDLRVPEQIRPEDRFRATVDLAGEGLVDREVEVALDIFRVGRKSDKPEGEIILVETKNGEPTGAEISLGERVTLKAPAKFLPGNPPHAQVEFPLDAAALAKAIGKEVPDGLKLEFKDDAEGQLRFQARVARDAREDFADKEHKSDPADVQVVKRPLRVLLMASGPMRDYQFVRTLLVRETDKNRAELSIYLQPAPGQEEPRKGRVQDVPPERLLGFFPSELRDEKLDKGDEKYKNLASYDVIVAYDPDWERLDPQQIRNLEQWVDKHGGGLIVIGGPVNTIQLARPAVTRDRNHKLRPIHNLYPVILADSRVQEVTRETDKPWRLNFPGATDDMEFLKIDEEAPKDKPLWGWELFFTAQGVPGAKPEPDKQAVRRGFYNFYPVKGKQAGAAVIATFTDDRARLEDGSEQPYIVTQPYGSGRTVWLGSAESWRLRQFKEAYHERFWTKLARYAGAGNTSRLNRRVILNMGRTFTANNFINVEAQVFGTDMKPLPQKSKIRVTVQPPASAKEIEKEQAFDLEPKPVAGGEWNGWFAGRFLVKTPGQYNLELEVPETKDRTTGKFTVKESNPELDNTRPDFTALHELASDARRVLERVPEEVRRELQERLRRRKVAEADLKVAKPETEAKKEPAAEERLKLYFDLSTADVIPSCMTVETKTQRNRGATSDLWDGGFTLWEREPPEEPIRMSYVLAVVAGLLSVEWLTRKLLRLA